MLSDARGSISMGEIGANLPFTPQRYFVVFDVPHGAVRGEHAHKHCHQFLVCLRGSISVRTDIGFEKDELVLNSPRTGLQVPPMIWGGQFNFTRDAILLVLASQVYDESEYIREYAEFLESVRKSVGR